jgi:hypothetical protein
MPLWLMCLDVVIVLALRRFVFRRMHGPGLDCFSLMETLEHLYVREYVDEAQRERS